MSRQALLRGVVAGIGVATVMLGGLYVFQSSLLYYPSVPGMPTRTVDNPRQYRSPSPWGLPFREAMVPCEDDVRVHIWLVMPPPPKDGASGGGGSASDSGTRARGSRDTLIFFHGNAASECVRDTHATHPCPPTRTRNHEGAGAQSTLVPPTPCQALAERTLAVCVRVLACARHGLATAVRAAACHGVRLQRDHGGLPGVRHERGVPERGGEAASGTGARWLEPASLTVHVAYLLL